MNLTIYMLTYIMASVPQVDRDGTPQDQTSQAKEEEGKRNGIGRALVINLLEHFVFCGDTYLYLYQQ